MHVYRGVQPGHELVEQRLFGALLHRVQLVGLNLLEEAVLLVDDAPNVLPVVGGVALAVVLQVYKNRVLVVVAIRLAPFVLYGALSLWVLRALLLLDFRGGCEVQLMVV